MNWLIPASMLEDLLDLVLWESCWATDSEITTVRMSPTREALRSEYIECSELAGEVQSESANRDGDAPMLRMKRVAVKFFMGSEADLGAGLGDDERGEVSF